MNSNFSSANLFGVAITKASSKVGVESSNPFARSRPLPTQTFSAIFGIAQKPHCRSLWRVRLGGSPPERYAKSLSEWRSLSEA